jgi:hypothetical protein
LPVEADPSARGAGRGWEAAMIAAAAVWFGLIAVAGIDATDEGWYVVQGYELSRGHITFRDVYANVAPLGFFIQAAFIELFGVHLLSGRICTIIEGVITVLIAFRLGRRHLRFPFSLVPGFLYLTYSVSLGAVTSYNLDAGVFLAVSLWLLDEHLARPRRGLMFAGALFGAAAVLTKQSFVLPAGGMLVITLALRKAQASWRELGPETAAAVLGLMLPAAPLLVFFAHHHALEEAYANLAGFPGMKKFHFLVDLPRALLLLAAGLLVVRLLIWLTRGLPSLFPRAAGVLPAAVWLLAAGGAGLVASRLPGLVTASYGYALLTVSLLLFVHPAPGTAKPGWTLIRGYGLLNFFNLTLANLDLGHILMGATGFVYPAGMLLQDLRRHPAGDARRPLWWIALAGLVLTWSAGLYLDTAVPFLSTFQGPKWTATAGSTLPGLEGIRMGPARAAELEQTVKWIQAHSGPEERIFVYPWDMVLYPLSHRSPATYYLVFYYELTNAKVTQRTIAELETRRPRVAVARMDGNQLLRVAFAPEARVLEAYLGTNYRPVERFGDFQVMLRKD